MFVRVKVTPNSPRKSVQIVASLRVGDKVRQKIVRYIGVAQNDEELEELKLLAESSRGFLFCLAQFRLKVRKSGNNIIFHYGLITHEP
ncbi:hypothetical protein [Candidatus Hakubella thermalkaliphila]|uniref:hypothetical protein n=1 Tax=Candidatus Hakubella thermalkaliphila TaxID=2754717 RepID=UPI001594156D|nr:hypothetical protein [Candidatus Hakubella thermalkaliphila]